MKSVRSKKSGPVAKKQPEFDNRLIGYARVSTLDQNLDMQIAYFDRLGIKPEHRFVEKLSARSSKRPQYSLMRKYIGRGDTLHVYSLSRLARSTEDLLRINKELLAEGVALVSATDPIDTRTADGKLMFTMRAAFAQFESDKTIERTREGIKARKDNGQAWGRPRKVTPEIELQMKKDLKVMSAAKVAKKHKISVPTVYQYTGGARTVLNSK